jgi:acyl-coenzyme A thioesterase PaaI-like protein
MYFGTGGRIKYIAANWREVRLSLGLNPFTYNYVGTIFGGAMFAANDPFLMVMLMNVMGKDKYVVWDKAAKIRFRKPGKSKLSMQIKLDEELIDEIKATIATEHKWTRWLTLQWKDKNGDVVAELERELYVADKAWYKQRRLSRKEETASAKTP